ncbi:glycerol-3-phosphate dehydrogenase [Undibacterium sp. RTI2.1]|uniref:glycerol-3-phosphate dehydrogenase n=1 Tax=unclassified Undibacterium TaxID=2630295 RepID=UPI002AB4BB0B|nr:MULTISPECIES: glycerol-3-phosphate dehydrogenase [unclassified Undibacterium]MDY7539461.1 glycerol-3-phosphate dehydrogenase [Undibacterium sp. 5I1]MEB0029621.1 glycerol-3-phosphate dehydrogenase [Undibacterium sp. RTI2.1]MEB0116092.1 glycerol-3-phosphate dehydrogenase [Undibacterium sp. RTI2.2]MEB0230720.1 glycerol-3-phosphate dehydrogenase [Undibacterium sp. 10I3]MEB0258801.1 glycerol-3-phosphate dehydrogenase [Undibacterium sp. 5I1]
MTQTVRKIECDVLVIGGGINGAGIARDAAGRGLSVVLCEKDDLASHTSSASSKLIHGGLRYLEYYEFGLVRKSLIEREVLLRSAPHIITPLRFVMPHMQGLRPAWMLRAGLFLYDHLARRELLPGSTAINLKKHLAGQALQANLSRGFEYSDGWVDDARLVVLNAIDAAEKGATIMTHTRCESVVQQDGKWLAQLRDTSGAAAAVNQITEVCAASLINATGSWAAQLQQAILPQQTARTLRLIKGSHIVVKRMFDHPYAYIFQHPDGRIVFVIPYENDFTLIGTTDINYQGDINKVVIDAAEIDYLCELSSLYFKQEIQPKDVLWSYSGVRPLVDDGSVDAKAITRDYHLELSDSAAPLLTVFGGKITTFRKLAEEAINLITPALAKSALTQSGRDKFSAIKPAWTANACLPGGDVFGDRPDNRAVLEFDDFIKRLRRDYPWMPSPLLKRYARAYGTRIKHLLEGINALAHMGEEIAPGLYAAEVSYLIHHEWARNAEDILWRRSKLGLHVPPGTASVLDAWIASK